MQFPLRDTRVMTKGCGSRSAAQLLGVPTSSIIPCKTAEGKMSTFTDAISGSMEAVCGAESQCTGAPMIVDADSSPILGTAYAINTGLANECEKGSPITDQAGCTAAAALLGRSYMATVTGATAADDWAKETPSDCQIFITPGLPHQGLYLNAHPNANPTTAGTSGHHKVCKLDNQPTNLPPDASTVSTPTCSCTGSTCALHHR